MTDNHSRIKVGRRVICTKAGPHKGKRGKVEDIFAGQAKVRFEASTVLEPLEYFKAV